MVVREHTLYDLHPFKFIETSFTAKNMVYLGHGQCKIEKKKGYLLLLSGVFHKYQLDRVG